MILLCKRFNINLLRKISHKFGFTDTEIKVILFLLIALFVGASINFLKNRHGKGLLEYNYEKEDSLFRNIIFSDSINSEKYVNAKVDYQQELLDFSNKKLKEKAQRIRKDSLELININSANISEFISLPGIGEKTAAEIINYRNTHGAFKKIEDLLKIKGIGRAKFDKIKNRITIK